MLFQGKYRVESTRLPNHNYAANGWYFVTICTRDRQHFFGNIETLPNVKTLQCNVSTDQMQLSPIGKIAQQYWVDIPHHFAHTYIDAYVIMPNHIHGIIVVDRPVNDLETLQCNVSTHPRSPQQDFLSQISPRPGSLSTIIRSYKSAVTRWCRKNGFADFNWQSRFYEHIVRADGSLTRIQQYIINNPIKWASDRQNFSNLWM